MTDVSSIPMEVKQGGGLTEEGRTLLHQHALELQPVPGLELDPVAGESQGGWGRHVQPRVWWLLRVVQQPVSQLVY